MSFSPPPLHHPQPRAPFHPPQPPLTPQNDYVHSQSPPLASPSYGQQGGYGGAHQGSSSFSSIAASQSYGGQPQQQPQQQPYGASPYYSGPPSHQQHPQAPAPQLWGVNDATAQMGVQFGKSAVAAGHNYVEKTFTRHLPVSLLKHSFEVTNSYVLRKLLVVLWPWRHGKWARSVRRSPDGGQADGWLSPRDDINAPDLYIPIMSLVTYILLSALHSGVKDNFHPEVLGVTASKALGVVVLEFVAIKLGTYLLDLRGGVEGVSGSLEMVMYGGYKFVGIIVCLLVALLFQSRLLWWSVYGYVVAANAFFLLRSLKYILLPDPASAPVSASGPVTLTHAQRTTRVRFLVFVAVAQVALMGILVWV